ncbi:MAG: N-acetyltransferase, partial [Pseudomonadales bacterium]
DLDALVKLELGAFKSSDGLVSRRAFRYHMNSANQIFVARVKPGGSCLAGYILVFNRKHTARIYSLAVDPEFRRQGVARALVRCALAQCTANRLQKVTLEVRATNISAIHLYKLLGFIEKRRRPNYYDDGEDACCMVLTLPQKGSYGEHKIFSKAANDQVQKS